MHGDVACELVRQLRNSKWLSTYNDDAIRKVVQEINTLNTLLEESNQNNDMSQLEVACGCFVHWQSILRNKRCILAYLYNRLLKIQALWWETGSFIPTELRAKLGPHEASFFSKYDKLIGTYMQEVDVDINLDQRPPKDLLIEVRVLRDCGTIPTESGLLHLEANTSHFVRRRDVELLIRQGALQQTS